MSGQRGCAKPGQIDGQVGIQVNASADQIGGAAVRFARIVFLVCADEDIGNPVAGYVTGAHPHAKAIEFRRTDQGKQGDIGGWGGKVQDHAVGGEIAQSTVADQYRQRARANSSRCRFLEILPGDQQITETIAGHIVHPDLAAGHFVGRRTGDCQDIGVRNCGINALVDLAVAEYQTNLPGICPGKRGSKHL